MTLTSAARFLNSDPAFPASSGLFPYRSTLCPLFRRPSPEPVCSSRGPMMGFFEVSVKAGENPRDVGESIRDEWLLVQRKRLSHLLPEKLAGLVHIRLRCLHTFIRPGDLCSQHESPLTFECWLFLHIHHVDEWQCHRPFR